MSSRKLAALPFPFSMQVDETTDNFHCSQLLVFVRHEHTDAIKGEFYVSFGNYEGR
jgi:hypothetical protein